MINYKTYWRPTPKKLRLLGDSLLGVSLFITSSAIATGNDVVAYISLGIGVVGKFMTNFFKEE